MTWYHPDFDPPVTEPPPADRERQVHLYHWAERQLLEQLTLDFAFFNDAPDPLTQASLDFLRAMPGPDRERCAVARLREAHGMASESLGITPDAAHLDEIRRRWMQFDSPHTHTWRMEAMDIRPSERAQPRRFLDSLTAMLKERRPRHGYVRNAEDHLDIYWWVEDWRINTSISVDKLRGAVRVWHTHRFRLSDREFVQYDAHASQRDTTLAQCLGIHGGELTLRTKEDEPRALNYLVDEYCYFLDAMPVAIYGVVPGISQSDSEAA